MRLPHKLLAADGMWGYTLFVPTATPQTLSQLIDANDAVAKTVTHLLAQPKSSDVTRQLRTACIELSATRQALINAVAKTVTYLIP